MEIFTKAFSNLITAIIAVTVLTVTICLQSYDCNLVNVHAMNYFYLVFLLSIFYSSSSQSVCGVFAKFLFPPAINITTTRPKIDGGGKEHVTRKEDLVV